MTDLLISRVAPGVARASSVDPFDSLVIHRIERDKWEYAPDEPGVYLLYGTADGKLTVYVGMSRTNMRSRIKSHHINPAKNWFGVLFAVPIASPLLCPAVEAELIEAVTEAGVVDVIDNKTTESLHAGVEDVHVEPAVEKIRAALQLLLGNDIFTPSGPEVIEIDPPVAHLTPLAREYRGAAAKPRKRTSDDPEGATHVFAKAVVAAWGRFEGDDPDKRFRVLSGSRWRPPVLNPDAVTYEPQVRVGELQKQLVDEAVLICRVVCQVGRVDRAHLVGWSLWSGGRDAGLGVGVASLMMRGLGTPGPGFVLPACAV